MYAKGRIPNSKKRSLKFKRKCFEIASSNKRSVGISNSNQITGRRRRIEPSITYECFSRNLANAISNDSLVRINTPYELAPISYKESLRQKEWLDIFENSFEELGLMDHMIGSSLRHPIYTLSGALDDALSDENFTISVDPNIIKIRFRSENFDSFCITTLSDLMVHVKNDSIVILAYLWCISKLSELKLISFDMMFGPADYEDFSDVENSIIDFTSGIDVFDENQSGEDYAIRIMDEIYVEYYRNPYHLNKIIYKLRDYNFPITDFVEVIKGQNIEQEDFFVTAEKIITSLDVWTDVYEQTIKELEEKYEIYGTVNTNFDDNIIFGYGDLDCFQEYEYGNYISTVMADMQMKFEECENYSTEINLKTPRLFRVKFINEIKKIIPELNAVKIYTELYESIKKILKSDEQRPFTTEYIENKYTEGNRSIFSWLNPNYLYRENECLSQWKSFRDFDIKYGGAQGTWDFSKFEND